MEASHATIEEGRRDGLDVRHGEHDLRSLMNAVLYVDRTGIPWRYLPHDFAPWATVYGYFAKWQQDGVSEELTGLLRRPVRESEGRDGEPPACVLDSRTVKTSANVHLTDQGTDAGKRIIGRKRHLGCDTLGLLLTVLVTAASVSDTAAGVSDTAASVSDTAAGVTLPTRIAAAHPHVTKAWADAGHRTTALNHGARLGIDVHPVQRPPGTRGFKIIPRRWTIERSIGRLMHHRRLARDYETHPHRSEATIHLATTDLMTRRLTGEATPNWHGT
ncbi:IS5 family transposase [Streptomyces sp. NPDC021093]|uniref:IS5 family transposase n=1 Tax=Streptomyces sp. NPDC021093 TaxID=3365112 RepID=UPI0037B7C628